MKQQITLTHAFVESVPSTLEDRTIYVSIPFATVSHNCCCGCGYRVVTPLSPTGWTLSFDGETISLHQSIGNWSFPCRSHYFITRNRVEWAPQWSRAQIEQGRAYDRAQKERNYGIPAPEALPSENRRPAIGWRERLKRWLP